MVLAPSTHYLTETSKQPCKAGVIIFHIFQMRKAGPRDGCKKRAGGTGHVFIPLKTQGSILLVSVP